MTSIGSEHVVQAGGTIVLTARKTSAGTWEGSPVNELARALAHWHFDGDGCLDPDRPLLRLGGAAVITPGQTAVARDNYGAGCERLGVHPVRPRKAQVAAVLARWVGPITLSPSHATKAGLGGR